MFKFLFINNNLKLVVSKIKESFDKMSGEFHKPLIQDAKAFLKAQPYFCINCKKFTDTFRYNCENCGTKNSLRKATIHDFEEYVKSKPIIVQNQIKAQKPIPKSESKPKSKDLMYKCMSCGIKLPSGYKFCPSCGSKINYEICRGCGRKLPNGYKFCPSCGLKLIHKEEPPEELKEQLVPIPKESRSMREDLESPQNIQEDQLIPISKDTQLNRETLESVQIKKEDQLQATVEDDQLSNEDEKLIPTQQKKKYKLAFYDCKFCGLKLPRSVKFCVQCGMIIKERA
jgi:predicted amidophosphoribosyltransferase